MWWWLLADGGETTNVRLTMHLQTRLKLKMECCIGWKVETSSLDGDDMTEASN